MCPHVYARDPEDERPAKLHLQRLPTESIVIQFVKPYLKIHFRNLYIPLFFFSFLFSSSQTADEGSIF